MNDWEKLIHASTDATWKANKFIARLKEHKAKYTEFCVERVAEYFAIQEPKVQGALAYADIAELNQQLRKHKFRTIAEEEAIIAESNRMEEHKRINGYTYDKIKDPYGG